MSASIRINRIARLLQKALGDIVLQETHRLLNGYMVTITEVEVSPDLSLAKVYLSVVAIDGEVDVVVLMEQQKKALRKLLGQRVGKKIRKVPDLRFYADNSVAYAANIEALLEELDIPAQDESHG